MILTKNGDTRSNPLMIKSMKLRIYRLLSYILWLGLTLLDVWQTVCASAVGAAIACPERQVINLQADGSGLYSAQALWTQVRCMAKCVSECFVPVCFSW